MEIADLKKFLVIARYDSLQKAAEDLDTTPGALSKSLKRLETSLSTQLFDRIGKSLRLNQQGRQLKPKASELVMLAKLTHEQIGGAQPETVCRMAAPAILQYRWAGVISRCLGKQAPRLELETVFEQDALDKLKQGDVQLALITEAMLPNLRKGISTIMLGELTMQVAAGRSHALVSGTTMDAVPVQVSELLKHRFATPHISPFCGEQRGVGCDGWQEQHFPREIGWVVNDYAVLGQLVRSGQAVAYLPDFMLREWQLTRLIVEDCPYQCVEKVYLAHADRCSASVRQLIEAIQ